MAKKYFDTKIYRVTLKEDSTSDLGAIYLYDDSGAMRVVLHFNESSAQSRPPSVNLNDTSHFYVPESRYVRYLDLLRNEGPLRFALDDSNKSIQLYTGNEFPGEGE